MEGFTFNISQPTMSPRLAYQPVFSALLTFPLALSTALAQHSESAQIELRIISCFESFVRIVEFVCCLSNFTRGGVCMQVWDLSSLCDGREEEGVGRKRVIGITLALVPCPIMV